MAGKSKNAGKKVLDQKIYCECGGEVRMLAKFDGKIKMVAKCNKCGAERRKPRDFKKGL
jgi:hypothetical protein